MTNIDPVRQAVEELRSGPLNNDNPKAIERRIRTLIDSATEPYRTELIECRAEIREKDEELASLRLLLDMLRMGVCYWSRVSAGNHCAEPAIIFDNQHFFFTGDYLALIESIGPERCRAAVEKARGA